jgi:hypothetical protein
MGQTEMGKYDFSSWSLHMASITIFATIWGFVLKEWRGTSSRTRGLVAVGLILLVLSTIIVGYGNYMKANQNRGRSAAASAGLSSKVWFGREFAPKNPQAACMRGISSYRCRNSQRNQPVQHRKG